MNLQPQDDQPGLWINPAWQEGTAGTFAVVIGVSDYPHLDGGGTPAEDFGEAWIQEAKRLGQLRVSALTAYRLFRWLAESYRFDAAPIAKCWLLLSPTGAEQQHTPEMTGHTAPATLGACERAVRAWRASIHRLPSPAQHDSRALFFFSGHGLQVTHERQVLLPSDYLAGDTPHWNDALSTYNLRFGMESLEVPHRYYFVDACRNDFQAIRGKGVRGREILPEDEAARAYGGIRAAAILYATAAAMQAWQPSDPNRGISLYGRALLDGLCGKPDIELKPNNGTVTVGFNKLEGFVGGRVMELLEDLQARVQQPVQPSGIVRDEVVTEIDKAALAASRPQVTQPPSRGPGNTLIVAGARSAEERSVGVERSIATAFTHERPLEPADQRGVWASDFNIGHQLFGSERVTEIWSHRLRVFALDARCWLDSDRLALHNVQHDESINHYRAELEIDNNDRLGHWLQVVDTAGTAHGCVLPADRSGRPRFTVEFDVARGDADYTASILRLQAHLSTNSPGPLSAGSELWRKYRHADVSEAVSRFELSALQTMVCEKLDSPLTATVAALILLRAGRMDLLHDWLKNLAEWIEELPDGPVLWAEQVLRQQPDRQRAFAEAAEYLGLVLQRGLPYTSEAFSYAVSLVDRLTAVADRLGDSASRTVGQVREQVESALVFFRPGGLFTSYSHFDSTGTPPGMSAG